MKKTLQLTKEEIEYLKNSKKILAQQGINLTDKDIREGLLGTISSFALGGPAGAALYWWLSDDAESAVEEIKDKMKEVLDASSDLMDSMEDLYNKIEQDSVKSAMEASGMAAYETIKAAMASQYEKIKADMDKLSEEKEGKEGEEKKKSGEETKEEVKVAGGSGPMAFAVMSAAVAKVLTELFSE